MSNTNTSQFDVIIKKIVNYDLVNIEHICIYDQHARLSHIYDMIIHIRPTHQSKNIVNNDRVNIEHICIYDQHARLSHIYHEYTYTTNAPKARI